ncbi:hypothetical protein VMCG_06606 [Cytospora schulzeri]|uniref:Sulfatase N-terminal domain-containing protein n=1 Tax=Cytospora schulzeri TaxID=448051 RepID=A0A423W700_9PEZI|nr:hypothetical protein VMCG_06606 [Valsa malicola]
MFRSLISLGALAASLVQATQPNILFVLTDDQDIELGSLNYLDTVTSRIQEEGFTYNNHYATVALCCPSRVAMLRGQHAHNTNNTNVNLPGGSFQKFVASGGNDNNLPHYLKRAGYRTEFIGKLMNGVAINNWDTVPAGWDRFDGMLDPWMYSYNTPVFSVHGSTPRYYNGSYLQDVVRAKAIDRIEKLIANETKTGEPWFLMVTPTAPHQTFNDTGKWPPVPAARHAHLFQDVKAPRTPNFNPAVNHKPSWIGKLPVMNSTVIDRVDETARARAQTLQSVDEMVAHMIDVLEEKGELDNTVIVFSSDHGYHMGQHRVPCGKTLPYKEDTHVPFMIRGPGIPKGLATDIPSNHIDIAPTLLALTGLDESEWPSWLDGRSLLPYIPKNHTISNGTSTSDEISHIETVNVEYWGNGIVEISGLGYTLSQPNNTYKTVRIISKEYSYMYAVWCTGESELYDTVADPYELHPIAANSTAEAARLTSRLNGLMLLLKTCIGDSCRAPWSVLHPDGSVKSLADALSPRYDVYYSSLPSVHYEACTAQYNLANEAPFFSSNYSMSLEELTTPHEDEGNFGVGEVPSLGDTVGWDGTYYGAVYEDLATIEARARDLTPDEMDWQNSKTKFRYMS